MSYSTKGIKRDAGGNPIPQYFNQAKNDFEPLQGSDGANLVKVVNPSVTVDNLPQVQNVSDANVKAELELIKQQQTQILARLDGTLNTQLTGSIGKGLIVESGSATLAQNDEVTILDINEPFVLEHIDWATNHLSAQFRMLFYREDGSFTGWGEITPNASGVSGISPTGIKNNGSANFNIIEFNENNNQYRFLNKKDIVVPTRLVITCRLLVSGTANFRWMLRGRKVR